MCGRLSLQEIEQLPQRFRCSSAVPLERSFNIPPGTLHPIVYTEKCSLEKKIINQLSLQKWGLWTAFNRQFPHIRWESRHKTFWRKLELRPCLIPVTGFFEWRQEDKQPFYFHMQDQSLFAIAGLFSPSQGAFALVTIPADSTLATIHPRFPCVLTQETEPLWLSQELVHFPAASSCQLRWYPVAQRVNNPKEDDEQLLDIVSCQQRLLFP